MTTDLARPPEASSQCLDPVVIERLMAALEAIVRARPQIDPELKCFRPAEAAEILGVTENWVTERITARTIPFTFVGRFPRFRARHIRAIAEQNEIDPATQGVDTTASAAA
ncbi:helix-turn-helix domain-containing protein [Streptomyces sp. H10-C2]|uniref:helix-turn-helix domain-containing protein n=1 Tax=unclassified Streptomyces TaxID=2593676 RepID=UPI0024BA772A|nr:MULTISPECIES: helix-turn-helix domain-containing protein [unclassified Streptomyces]MDJ0342180.1 helix-turn-helix domain-containing protein [Streptomyces sp. PH10-H1]MDJ0368694.1 helix-turn-helix domain-containing protein [Streptomyces sp. H10-C2]